jgi:hypothetical protein
VLEVQQTQRTSLLCQSTAFITLEQMITKTVLCQRNFNIQEKLWCSDKWTSSFYSSTCCSDWLSFLGKMWHYITFSLRYYGTQPKVCIWYSICTRNHKLQLNICGSHSSWFRSSGMCCWAGVPQCLPSCSTLEDEGNTGITAHAVPNCIQLLVSEELIRCMKSDSVIPRTETVPRESAVTAQLHLVTLATS